MKLLSLFDGLYEITDNISCGKASQCANGKRKGVKGLVICYE